MNKNKNYIHKKMKPKDQDQIQLIERLQSHSIVVRHTFKWLVINGNPAAYDFMKNAYLPTSGGISPSAMSLQTHVLSSESFVIASGTLEKN